LSGPKFAALHGVKYQTFAAWLQKRKRGGTPAGLPAPAGVALVEIEVPVTPHLDRGLRLVLPGGAELHLDNHSMVPLAAALVRELSRPC
jgi:hypothetical protein